MKLITDWRAQRCRGTASLGKGLSRDGNLQGIWPLSSSEKGAGVRSQITPRHPGPAGVPQGHRGLAAALPSACPCSWWFLTTTADALGQWAELSPGMHLAKGSWQSLHCWDRVFGAAHIQWRCGQPQLRGTARREPLGEGILKHPRPRPAFPASRHCCKRSKDTGFKAEEHVLQAAVAHPERLPAARRK